MTVLCTSCGEPLADEAYRCPVCDSLAPLPPVDDERYPRTVFDQPAAVTLDDPDDPDDPDDLPWEIPLSERGSRRRADGAVVERDPMKPVLIAVLVIAMIAGFVVVGGVLVGGGNDDTDTAAGDDVDAADTSTSAPAPPDTGPTFSTVDPDTTSTAPGTSTGPSTTTGETTTTETTTTETTTTQSTTTSTTTSATTVPASGAAPRLSSSFGGGWVAQLASISDQSSDAEVDAAWRKASAYAPRAVVTDSANWSSLSAGFEVVLDPGPFESADAVRAFCSSAATGDAGCIPRELSGRR